MFDLIAKLLELIGESISYPVWKRKERFKRRQQIVSNVRFAISQWTLQTWNPEFKGQNWWLEIRDHIDPELCRSLEMKKTDLNSVEFSSKHVPYEYRIEALTTEVGRLAKKWQIE